MVTHQEHRFYQRHQGTHLEWTTLRLKNMGIYADRLSMIINYQTGQIHRPFLEQLEKK